MKEQSGLTFIELTIVILIIGLILAMAAPNFMRFLKSTKTGSVARKMAGYIIYLQEKAIRDNTKYLLVLDIDSGRYWATTEIPDEKLPIEYYYSAPRDRTKIKYPEIYDDQLKTIELEPGISMPKILDEDNRAQFQGYRFVGFYPDGTADRTTIYIVDSSDSAMTVYIKPYFARPEIYDGIYEIEPFPVLVEQD